MATRTLLSRTLLSRTLLSRTLRRVLALTFAVALLGAGCATEAPEVPLGADGQPDAVLQLGRDVFGSRCSNCHGSSGGGGTGPRLAGAVEQTFPDPVDQEAVVRDGRRNMPSFGGTLSDAEIEAVVRYTREVLD
jgi:mono/diheme cytochrome c family protein